MAEGNGSFTLKLERNEHCAGHDRQFKSAKGTDLVAVRFYAHIPGHPYPQAVDLMAQGKVLPQLVAGESDFNGFAFINVERNRIQFDGFALADAAIEKFSK